MLRTTRGRSHGRFCVGDRDHIPPMWPETALGEGCGLRAAAAQKAAQILHGGAAGFMSARSGNLR
jgi:hypothetical protein